MAEEKGPFSRDEPAATRTILVVEDDFDIGIFLIEAITQETPYRAFLATDANQAMDIARKIKPSAVLLDYQLPGMNGIELYDQLHATNGLEDTPAIMASARVPTHAVEERHIPSLKKPFELEELLQTIEEVLENSEEQ
jgi:DNA-binding response OmpR family regulator